MATLVTSGEQEQAAARWLRSVRRFGGPYAEAPVLVVVDDPVATSCTALTSLGARVVRLVMPETARGVPYAAKAYAAAQVEAEVASSADTLAWFDTETLVLAPPAAMDLSGSSSAVALRPVTLANKVGLAPEAGVDAFWSRIYAASGVAGAAVPAVTTAATGEAIRAYYFCGVIAYRPSRGICREWARVLTTLVGDAAWLKAACADAPHRIFLHQAVLSAVVLARTRPDERRELPLSCSYPANVAGKLRPSIRVANLGELAVVIVEDLDQTQPGWQSLYAMPEAVRTFLEAEKLAVPPG